ERVVGPPAKHQQVTNPKNTIFSIKRFMGRRHSEVSAEEKLIPYEVTGGPEDFVKVRVRGKEYTPQEISAFILQDLKKVAEDYLGEPVDRAVITVPAYFNDSQRQATKDAGEIAGLKVERIINEPTAAALAYGNEKGRKNQKIAVFDLGGGTFDVTILEIGDDGEGGSIFDVLSTNGDTHLGGDDWDQRLIDFLADEFKKLEGVDIRQDAMALQRLKEGAEKAKVELSTMQETTVNLPFITATDTGPKHLQISVTRTKFEGLCEDLYQRLGDPCRQALADANVDPSKIDEVVLVGGSTRMPRVQEIAEEIFGREPNRSVNPDEVVAVGAAVQGGVLQGDVKDVLLLDVTPLSLGVETKGGVMTRLIERNTTIPKKRMEIFSTAADNQTSVTIRVLQGEREFAADNRLLGQFDLSDIPPSPMGMPQIEVEFNIDANGILQVTATEKTTSKSADIKITNSGGLSDEEMNRMKSEAEAHADEDRKRRELVDLKNRTEAFVSQTLKSLEEHGGEVTGDVRGKIESALSNVENKLKGDDKDALEAATRELESVCIELDKVRYEKARQEAGGGSQQQSADGDDVIDAEYEVKDDG
ncbi:MAG: molecular chaperone DnaK, partial [Planctomycetes bacterium]|nr:molecular chaperone DnaK [Planctomycetota bacterium]